MSTIALTVFVILAAIAALHVAWAFGVRWPAQDERGLVALVVGATGRTRLPSMFACLQAAAAIFIAGVVALMLAQSTDSRAVDAAVTVFGSFIGLVFALRGVAAYVPAWRLRFSQQPFVTLDQYFYGPLSLLLAAAFALLVFRRMVS